MAPLSLTNEMKNLLKTCHQNELDGLEPCNPITHGFANELLILGLINLRPHTYENKERKAAYFLTEKGREVLKEMENNKL